MLSMKVIVQSLGFKASSSLDSFIHEKLKSIKYEKLIGANVVLHKGGENSNRSFAFFNLFFGFLVLVLGITLKSAQSRQHNSVDIVF